MSLPNVEERAGVQEGTPARSSVGALHCAEELRESPHWALSVIACPDCYSELSLVATVFQCASCGPVGQWKDGIACFERGRGASDGDESIKWYQSIGGTHYHERAQIPLSMSALDTPVYHQWLLEIAPERLDGPILDVGAGDGRQTDLWLTRGYERVVAVDAVSESLSRFRSRLAAEHPDRSICSFASPVGRRWVTFFRRRSLMTELGIMSHLCRTME